MRFSRREMVRNRREITVKRHKTVRKHREITVSRHEMVRKRRVLINKRHEITVLSLKFPIFGKNGGKLDKILITVCQMCAIRRMPAMDTDGHGFKLPASFFFQNAALFRGLVACLGWDSHARNSRQRRLPCVI